MSSALGLSAMAELAHILVLAALTDKPEITSVEAISDVAGMSRRAFQNRCQAVGVTGRDCVHFAQCLKSIPVAAEKTWEPSALIPVTDPRTLRRILAQAGLADSTPVTVSNFIARQRFCTSPWFKEAILAEVARSQKYAR